MGKGQRQRASKAEEELHSAARSGELVSIQSILSSDPLAINSRDKHSRTPLHLASWFRQTEAVSYLCKNRADVSAAALDDMAAIHFDCTGNEEVWSFLEKCENGEIKADEIAQKSPRKEEDGPVNDAGESGQRDGAEDKGLKRKGDDGEDGSEEAFAEPKKKKKVVLSHFMTEDDTQNDDEAE